MMKNMEHKKTCHQHQEKHPSVRRKNIKREKMIRRAVVSFAISLLAQEAMGFTHPTLPLVRRSPARQLQASTMMPPSSVEMDSSLHPDQQARSHVQELRTPDEFLSFIEEGETDELRVIK